MAKFKKVPSRTTALTAPAPADFDAVLRRIDAARGRAVAAVNQELIGLYGNIGEHISRKIVAGTWGEGTVQTLAEYLRRHQLGMSGFSASNLWRMRQFDETYGDDPKLARLVRELSWTHNLLIMSRCQREKEREFYLRLCPLFRPDVPFSGRGSESQVPTRVASGSPGGTRRDALDQVFSHDQSKTWI